MSIYRRDDSPVWYVNIRNGGRRIRRSTGTEDREEARQIHDQLAARAWKIRAHGKCLSDALLAWFRDKPRKTRDLQTLKQIRREYPDRPLSRVTEESIGKAFGDKSNSTYNRIVNVLRAALNIARERGWIDAAPKLKRLEEPAAEPRFLTAEEWRKLRAELPEHLVPMAEFAIATGLRWANVAGLTWERVSLTRKLVWIPARSTKAKKTITVPLSTAALQTLRSVPGERKGFVFTYQGKPIGSAKTAWRKARIRAGVSWCRWHDLRHSWASWHAMRGTPIDVLQQLGAWQTREMVERYAHLAPSYVAQFAGNARPVGHSRGHSRGRKAAG